MPNDFEKFGDITRIKYKNENNVRLKGGEAPRQNILNRL